MAATLLGGFLQALYASPKVLGVFEQLGKKSMLKRLEDITDTVERFKEALRNRDEATLVQTFNEYQTQVTMLQERVLNAISYSTNMTLHEALIHGGREPEMLFLEKIVLNRRPKSGKLFKDSVRQLEFQLNILIGTLHGICAGLRATLADNQQTSKLPARKPKSQDDAAKPKRTRP
jgi:hypothetical protein